MLLEFSIWFRVFLPIEKQYSLRNKTTLSWMKILTILSGMWTDKLIKKCSGCISVIDICGYIYFGSSNYQLLSWKCLIPSPFFFIRPGSAFMIYITIDSILIFLMDVVSIGTGCILRPWTVTSLPRFLGTIRQRKMLPLIQL